MATLHVGTIPIHTKLRRFIMLYDSGTEDRFSLRPILHQFGYTVCPANTPQEAMDYIHVVVPTLIILDTVEPLRDTNDLIARMKQAPGCADVPVILVSSFAPPKAEEQATPGQISAFIRKPVQTEELYRAVQKAMEMTPRQNIRITTCLRAFQGDAGERTGFATELSEHGMFLRTITPQPVNTRVPVRLWTEDREIRLEAQVIHRTLFDEGSFRGPGMGMRFVSIKPDDQTYIREFILKQLKEGMQVAEQ
jgi:CheY-like chemotaxis protein